MTLCVAQKIGPAISLISDSRIMNVDHYSDDAIKVLPLAINITTPVDSETGKDEVLFSSSFGFAFAGTFQAQNAIKGFLDIACQQLQFVPTFGPLTFERICGFVMDIYNHISRNLFGNLKDSDVIDFFLTGTCPDSGKVKLAKYFIDYGPEINEFNPMYQIYEDDADFPLAIGVGTDRFYKAYKKDITVNRQMRAINALQTVIDDQQIASVGGNLQYGESQPRKPFCVDGIIVPEFHENGFPKVNHFCFGGIDVLGNIFDEVNGLFISGTFLKLHP